MGNLKEGVLMSLWHYFNAQITYGRYNSPKIRLLCCPRPTILVSTLPTTSKHIIIFKVKAMKMWTDNIGKTVVIMVNVSRGGHEGDWVLHILVAESMLPCLRSAGCHN